MTLKTLVDNIGMMGKAQKLIGYSCAGTSLDQINAMTIDWYPLLFTSPTGNHTVMQNTTTYEITLYYLDRLLEDYSNDLEIFSAAVENLKNLITGIRDIPGVVDVIDNYAIRNFTYTEKMNDSLAGAYATVRVKVVNEDICFVEGVDEPVPPEPIDYSKEYFTIEALSGGTFYVRMAIDYSVNGAAWETTTGETELSLNQGDAVRFKGTDGGIFLFTGNTLSHNVYGNIESLEYGDDYIGQTTIKNSLSLGAFGFMFSGSTGTRNVENLILPATTLKSWCYHSMFENCTSLTTTPELPATTLAQLCYSEMFSGCTSLSTAPELPATELADYCYRGMFQGCSNITKAPELPAITLAYACYSGMFGGCTSLTTTPELPATTLAISCYQGMFSNCTSLTTAPELPATIMTDACYDGMFFSCTNLTTAPELPATTLAENCYMNMFGNCTSLATAPELLATTLKDWCYYRMFSNCRSLNYIKCLATDISADWCTTYWLNSVASTGTFVKAASMEGWTRGESGIPSGWTIADA